MGIWVLDRKKWPGIGNGLPREEEEESPSLEGSEGNKLGIGRWLDSRILKDFSNLCDSGIL